MQSRHYILTVSCPDRVGIVAAVSSFLAANKGWITEASHHSEPSLNWFFMRHEILADSLPFDVETFREKFTTIAKQFDMRWNITDSTVKKRIAIFVSQQDHCLSDLLHRWRNRELDFDLCCVISNHDTLRSFVEWHNVPFHHVPVASTDKSTAFKEIASILQENRIEARGAGARYMQILPLQSLCAQYPGRIINIHHSFLPSFAGAKPYHQAFERGVKLIGATCHYVTQELDAGPIIEQDVIRVDHSDTIEDLVRLEARRVEKTVLARGLKISHTGPRAGPSRTRRWCFSNSSHKAGTAGASWTGNQRPPALSERPGSSKSRGCAATCR